MWGLKYSLSRRPYRQNQTKFFAILSSDLIAATNKWVHQLSKTKWFKISNKSRFWKLFKLTKRATLSVIKWTQLLGWLKAKKSKPAYSIKQQWVKDQCLLLNLFIPFSFLLLDYKRLLSNKLFVINRYK